jgi:hypothetical protein
MFFAINPWISGTAIYSFDQVPIKSEAWESLEHITLT